MDNMHTADAELEDSLRWSGTGVHHYKVIGLDLNLVYRMRLTVSTALRSAHMMPWITRDYMRSLKSA